MVVVVWRDPPEVRANAILKAELLAALRAEPGRWALVKRYEKTHGSHKVNHPDDIEVRWCHYVNEGVRSVELYARARPQ